MFFVNHSITRRSFVSAAAASAALLSGGRSLLAKNPATTRSIQRYRIGAADIMLLKRQKLGAMQLAHDCELDGVEVDLGSLGNRPDIVNELRQPELRQKYLEASKNLGVEICS